MSAIKTSRIHCCTVAYSPYPKVSSDVPARVEEAHYDDTYIHHKSLENFRYIETTNISEGNKKPKPNLCSISNVPSPLPYGSTFSSKTLPRPNTQLVHKPSQPAVAPSFPSPTLVMSSSPKVTASNTYINTSEISETMSGVYEVLPNIAPNRLSVPPLPPPNHPQSYDGPPPLYSIPHRKTSAPFAASDVHEDTSYPHIYEDNVLAKLEEHLKSKEDVYENIWDNQDSPPPPPVPPKPAHPLKPNGKRGRLKDNITDMKKMLGRLLCIRML